MALTLFKRSQQQLDRVLDKFKELEQNPEADPQFYTDLGRMLMAMFRCQTHPARMFQLLLQAAQVDGEDSQIEPLTLMAWIMAENGLHELPSDGEIN